MKRLFACEEQPLSQFMAQEPAPGSIHTSSVIEGPEAFVSEVAQILLDAPCGCGAKVIEKPDAVEPKEEE